MNLIEISRVLRFYIQKIVPASIVTILLPILLNLAGSNLYKKYSLTVLLISFFVCFFSIWVSQSTIRNIENDKLSRNSILLMLKSSLLSSSIGSISFCIFMLFPFFNKYFSLIDIYLLLITVFILIFQAILYEVFLILENHKLCFYSEFSRSTLALLFIISSLKFKLFTTALIPLSFLLASSTSFIFLLPILFSLYKKSEFKKGVDPNLLTDIKKSIAYGGSLSLLHSGSAFFQFSIREHLLNGTYVFIADLSQKLITLFSGPLILSHTKKLLYEFKARGRLGLSKTIINLTKILSIWFLIVLFVVFCFFKLDLWIFSHFTYLLATIFMLTGYYFLQLSTIFQKEIEYNGKSLYLFICFILCIIFSLISDNFFMKTNLLFEGADFFLGSTIYFFAVLFGKKYLYKVYE